MTLGEISGAGNNNVSRVRGYAGRSRSSSASSSSDSSTASDEIQISEVGRFVSEANALEPIRHDVIAEVRAKIARGDYDDPEVLRKAVNAMIDDVIGSTLGDA